MSCLVPVCGQSELVYLRRQTSPEHDQNLPLQADLRIRRCSLRTTPNSRQHHASPYLAICKPATRRAVKPGGRILGLTSKALAPTHKYPSNSVIHAAIVDQNVSACDYFASIFQHRLDCIYPFCEESGKLNRFNDAAVHSPNDIPRDLSHFPGYENDHVLLSNDFRCLESLVVKVPGSLPLLVEVAEHLGRGHTVCTEANDENSELDVLFHHLWDFDTACMSEHVDLDARWCRRRVAERRRNPGAHRTRFKLGGLYEDDLRGSNKNKEVRVMAHW